MDIEIDNVCKNGIFFQLFKEFLYTINKEIIIPKDEKVLLNNNQLFFVYQNGELFKQNIEDLLYVKADGSYSKLYIVEENKVKCVHVTGNIRSIERSINNKNFIRTHRSFIVNMVYAKTITKNRIFFDYKYKDHYAKISQDGLKRISELYPIIGCKL